MKRRYFLGLALSTMASPVLASTAKKDRPRVLSLHHLNTDERIDITYRIGDRYQRSALQKLNYFCRDFRTGSELPIDPQLFDLLYDLKVRLGDPHARYEVLSAYRSPRTNAMLRATSHGVAKHSLHILGQAIDIRFPDLPLTHLRDTAIAMGRGGVGYYRRSHFVHLDTGSVRRWSA